MRVTIVVGATVLLTASVAMATTAEVFFSIRGANGCPLNAIDPSVDPFLYITTSVRVTGDNQGLAGYMTRFGIRDLSLPIEDIWVQNWAKHVIPRDNLFWATVYDTAPADGVGAAVVDRGIGPGMAYGTSLGTPDPALAFVDQLGAGHLDWVPRRYKTSPPPAGWAGDNTWGVGLDSRKSALLLDPNGTYDLNVIVIDLSSWHAGDYRVEMEEGLSLGDPPHVPNIGASVLEAGLNLNTMQPSVSASVDLNLIHAGGFDFTIVPEPSAVLLLGMSFALMRRRRA